VRDRISFDPEEMAALEASLRARGQQVPVEVVPLDGEGAGEGRYGLISGLRRVMALRAIGAGEALALVRRPESSADAYLAMVEENEIRSGISFYERARLASEAVRLGLYTDASAAIAALFSSASPAKRSKIGSFVRVHEALGHSLRYPTAIPERLGLALAGLLGRDPGMAGRISEVLRAAAPDSTEAERALLEQAVSGDFPKKPKPAGTRHKTEAREIARGIRMETRQGRVVLSGAGITDELKHDLEEWLACRN
jgi:ParB family chromosome partitioning protein